MLVKSLTVALPLFLVGMLPAAAQTPSETTLTIALTGTLGPVLAGPDPLGVNGHTGSLTVIASESMTPSKVTSNTAVYTLPPGAVTGVIGLQSFTTTTSSKMAVTLSGAADIITVVYNSRDNSVTTVTAYLAPGSWDTNVMIHPLPFSPSPQDLKSATVAGGPGSQFKYTKNGTLTVLGMNGTASSSAPLSPVVPEPVLQ